MRPEERDLLAELAADRLSETEAYAVLDEVREQSVLPRSLELVGMSPAEWMAAARGLPLGVLAGWREEGWPCDCLRCGADLDPDGLAFRVLRGGDDRSGFGLGCERCG